MSYFRDGEHVTDRTDLGANMGYAAARKLIDHTVALLRPDKRPRIHAGISADAIRHVVVFTLFGDVTDDELAEAAAFVRNSVSPLLQFEIRREPFPPRVRELVSDVLAKRENAAFVLLDALLEHGFISDRDIPKGADPEEVVTRWAKNVALQELPNIVVKQVAGLGGVVTPAFAYLKVAT